MSTHAPLRVRGGAAAGAAALAAVLAVPATAPPAQASPAPAAPTQGASGVAAAAQPGPRFSAPEYYPLRAPARVSCVVDNCRPAKRTHGYWALDLLGRTGDPVYAAGSGIVHVGGRFSGCGRTRAQKAGTWLWIDHGGGMVSRYYHLSGVAVRDGQHVTPATRIGAMGRSGARTCQGQRRDGAYLHYEERVGGPHGRRVDPGPLRACLAGAAVRYPDRFGVRSWNDLRPYTRKARSEGVDCLPAPPRTGPPTITPTKRLVPVGRVNVSWSPPVTAPDLVTGYVVTMQVWRIGRGAWSRPDYLSAPAASTSRSIPGVRAKRSYRFTVTALDAHGASVRSAPVVVRTKG